ncbi:unnamed protein product [Linum trigynum]|uniref:CCHC-type domain-containing protein n=1 Tax=Linum trigynum TaxID=586398 RepID=A0AAV2GLS1_9ROSI
MRATAAELAIIQAPVTNEDMVLHCLRGLREEFGPIAAAFRARDTTIALEDLHNRLVEYEADLANVRAQAVAAPTTACSTSHGLHSPRRQSPRKRGSPRRQPPTVSFQYDFYPRCQPPVVSYQCDSYSHGHPGSHITAAPPSLLGRPQLQCQFCDKPGHTAKDCYRIRG